MRRHEQGWTAASLHVNNDNKEINVNSSQQTLISTQGCSNKRKKKSCERVYMVVSHKLHPKQMASSNVQWWSYKQAIKTSELKRHILVNPEILTSQ